MKNTLIGIGVVVIIGGATYALVPGTVLKQFFERGDKPTEQQFANTIDSTVNLSDDSPETGSKEYDSTKVYSAGDTVIKSESISQAKVLTQDQKEFSLDAAQSITFRWTPLVPKPKEPVTYRLRVWQLMQGQNGTQAMKANDPIVTKNVTNASEVTVSGIYTGPCKPPYLCDFVWGVEAISTTNTGSSGAATSEESVSTQTDTSGAAR